MRPRFPFHRIAHGLAAVVCAALLACSGAEGLPTDPNPDPPGDEPTIPVPPEVDPPGHENPGPPQPTTNVIAGVYTLVVVNDGEPGQVVTLSNPDGRVIGLYRFRGATLGMTEQQTWSLELHFEDEKGNYDISDEGRFKRFGEDLRELSFESAVYGDVFEGRALDGVAVIKYDMDGDGQADTIFGFERILGPGT